jgi:formyltetrahydrofolate hydrolase
MQGTIFFERYLKYRWVSIVTSIRAQEILAVHPSSVVLLRFGLREIAIVVERNDWPVGQIITKQPLQNYQTKVSEVLKEHEAFEKIIKRNGVVFEACDKKTITLYPEFKF